MQIRKPEPWLFFLIAGVGLWTDLHHLTGGDWSETSWLYTISCFLLVAALLTFLSDQMILAKLILIGGMGLAVLGAIIS